MYGVVGRGTAPQSVIHTSLDDIGMKMFVIPWYQGNVSDGLTHVYDWLLDNDVPFIIVRNQDAKPIPKILREKAADVNEVDDVSRTIINMVYNGSGHTLVMWDENDEDESVRVATMSIDRGLPTLELTNGMVPIVFDESPTEEAETTEDFVVEAVSDLPVDEDSQFTRAEMENMPAATVKRHGANKGLDVKSMTKVEIIDALYGTAPEVKKATLSIEDRLDHIEEMLRQIVAKL